MRFINHDGRMTLLSSTGRGIDLATASDGALPSAPAEAYERWQDVIAWARTYEGDGDVTIDEALIGAPSPNPREMIGVGLNYAAHAAEGGLDIPEYPLIFTKLAASTAGPYEDVVVSTDAVDWETELIVVMGARARYVKQEDAWDHVAGLTVGQDLTDRTIQFRPDGFPQFGLGKSLPGFGPTGPELVTIDEIDDPDDLEVICLVNGEEMQRGRTNDLIFSVPRLIEYLSDVTELYPGDVIMTGTPSGIGHTRKPPVYLQPGDVLESRIVGLGTMTNRMVAPVAAAVGG